MSDRRDPAVEAVADALDRGLRRAQEAIDRAARKNARWLEVAADHTGEEWLRELARGNAEQMWGGVRARLAAQLRENVADAFKPRWQRKLDRRLEKQRLRAAEKAERRRLREEAHRHHAQEQSWLVGGFMLLSACAMGALAFTRHDLWFMVFPAFGIGTGGAAVLGSKLSARALPPWGTPRNSASSAETDSRDARVDAVCEKILAELENASPAVKALIGQSQKTIEQLRATCRSLTQRERELRALVNPDDDARLSREREALAARLSSEADAVVRARFESALAALDEQRKQRAELHTAASRFEAEHTRIGYTLENLFTQLLRLKSADSASHDAAGAALRQNLSQLGEELDAVAEAMEAVNRGELTQVVDVTSGDSASAREKTRSRE